MDIQIDMNRLCTTFIVLGFLAPNLHALDAKQVYEAVAPSTVLIQALDSAGSGVFLDERGLILTNYHVVASNLDIKIKARIKVGGKMDTVEIRDVRIVKVHPTYDLALLQATPPSNGTFIPARVIPKQAALAPGIKCFAIGNPGGLGGDALELSITEGIVSSASRHVDGQDFVQFSAAINPGNSGGPVCDDQGRVIGIATWKMTETEGLGFAIPTQKVSIAEFVELKAKKPNKELGEKALEAGKRYLLVSQLAGGADRQTLLVAAAECFRIAMQAVPNSPAPYNNLCIVFQKVGEDAIARKYVEAAIKIDPNCALSCHLLGTLMRQGQESNEKITEQCIEIWFHGLSDADKGNASRCAEDIATCLIDQKKFLPAAYMFRWCEVLMGGFKDAPNADARAKTWTLLETSLPAEQAENIRRKDSGFSRTEFASLVTGKPLASVPLPAKTSAAPSPAVSSIAIPPITEEQMKRVAKEAEAKFSPLQLAVPSEGREFPLPDFPEKAILAHAGWQVVISFPDLAKLGVFNLATGKIDGFIDCADRQAILAAGGHLLATYLPDSQTIELYDLRTLVKVLSKKSPLPGPISFLGMGLLNPNRLFVLYEAKSERGLPFYSPALLKIPDLSRADLLPDIKNGNNPLWGTIVTPNILHEGTMDEAGTVAAVTRPKVSPTGLAHYSIREDGKINFTYVHETLGLPMVSQTGNLVVCRRQLFDVGTQDNPYSRIGGGLAPYIMAPVAGFPAFVELRYESKFGGFRVRSVPAMNLITEFPLDPAKTPRLTHSEGNKQHEIMLASAYCDKIAFLLPEAKKILLFPLGLKSGAAGSSFAQPGQHFERKLSIQMGASATIQSGPAGMKFEPSTNSLIWDVPPDAKTGQLIQVILLIKSADLKEEYLVEKISVQQ